MFDLRISLATPDGATGLDPRHEPERDRLRGGPDTLLTWLETQLGIPRPKISRAERVVSYLGALEKTELETVATSLAVHPLATAEELLARRDELIEEGWDRSGDSTHPLIVQDLARVEATVKATVEAEAAALQRTAPVEHTRVERIRAVHSALDAGQVLPAHRVLLAEAIESWPRVWQPLLLKRLETQFATEAPPPGLASWVAVRSPSLHRAAQWVARQIATWPESTPLPVIVAEDPMAASVLSEALCAEGLPPLAVESDTASIPVTQVFPLALELSWHPVFPQRVVDFLGLAAGPIPGRAARTLARAMAEKPGLGSSEWELAWARMTDPEVDPDGTLTARLERWLMPTRYSRTEGMPPTEIADRSRLVSQWLAGRIARLEADPARDDELPAWRVALGHATQLAQLASSIDEESSPLLPEPRVRELLAIVERQSAPLTTWIAQAGAPRWVKSWCEVTEPIHDAIWFGIGTREPRSSRWSRPDLDTLHDHRIPIDDGTRRLEAERHGERRGLAHVVNTLWTWRLPADLERRAHPLWLELVVADGRSEAEVEQNLETWITHPSSSSANRESRPETQRIPHTERAPTPTVWRVDPSTLRERDYSSASELEARLGCPLRWTFNYAARLRARDGSQLKRGPLLFGDFCHHVLERLLTGEERPSVEAATRRVAELFDERLPLEAAELAQPDRARDRLKLRQQLQDSTRTLVTALERGEYRIVGVELPLTSTIDQRPLTGFIDCEIEDPTGRRAVIDFKYSSAARYRDLLAKGRAIQLATYASGRDTDVAYLALTNATLHTPEGSPLRNALPSEVVAGAPAIDEVWRRFERAIRDADSWMSDGVLPVRPRQGRHEWSTGVDLVVQNSNYGYPPEPTICRYCDYRRLCGQDDPR